MSHVYDSLLARRICIVATRVLRQRDRLIGCTGLLVMLCIFPILVCVFAEANAIRRFRLSFLGLLAISAVLHIFSTNSTLNLQDTVPTGTFLTHTEHLRARIVSGSFAFGAAFTIALLFVLGEDDAALGSGTEYDNQQPLINNELGV